MSKLPLLVEESAERKRTPLQIPPECKTLLIGEGRNDARFLAALARHMGNIAACGHPIGSNDDVSIGRINDELKSAVLSGGFLALCSFAIVLDADRNAKSALGKMNESLKACFEIDRKFAHGDVFPIQLRGEEIFAGVFIMPGIDSGDPDKPIQGMLEDLVLRAAAQTNQKEMQCVGKFRECVRDIGNKPKKNQDEEKKKAQALLSALPKNKVYLGVAAEDKVIDFSAPAYDELKSFLKKLAP